MPTPSSATGYTAIRPLLKRLGLDEKEVEVYLALLPLKVARTSDISKASRQSRSHTYLILRSLREKGLVSEIERGKIIHFVAEPPERLLQYLEDRERELRELQPIVEGALPLLKNMTTPLVGKPRVTMHSGMQGMRDLYRDVFKQEFCALFNPEVMYETFDGPIEKKLFGKHAVMIGRDLLVESKTAHQYIEDSKDDEQHIIRLLPKGMSFDTDTIIFGDTVAFFAYDDEKTIVRIQNQNIADSFRAWFEALWGLASPASP